MAKSTMNYTYASPDAITWMDEESGESKVFNFTTLSSDIQSKVLSYGAQHLLRDRTSAIKSGAAKLTEADKLYSRLMEGEWKAVRTSSGGSPKTTLIIEALSRLQSRTTEEIRNDLEVMEVSRVKAIRNHPQVKLMMQNIKTERLTALAEGANDDAESLDSLM